jgi:arylsulfatase A-like enzyme
VLAKVREHQLEENTLVVFFSDNGGPTPQTTSGNGPLRGFKSQTWEGGVRVPFMMQWKGKIPAGKVDDRPVIQLDLLPTALAAAGVEVQADWKIDGKNLLPYVTGERSEPPHEALYWRFGQQVAIRMGDWKLVKAAVMKGGRPLEGKAATEGAELYNLRIDIGEKENLAAKEPEKFKQLAAAWDKWNAGNVDPAWRPGFKPGPNAGKKSGKGKKAAAK